MKLPFLVGRILLCAFVILSYEFQARADDDCLDSHGFGFPDAAGLRSRSRRHAEDDKFDGLVPKDYNLYELPPTVNGEPTKMNLTLLLFNVRDIKEIGEELTLELNMQMQWKDSRVKPEAEFAARNVSDYLILTPSMLQKLWYPDIYIDHVKSVSQPVLVSKPASLRIYKDGKIRYSTRLTITTSCHFDFHYYPADTQRCNLEFKSYAYTDRDLYLAWRQAAFAFKLEASNFYVGMDKTGTFPVKTSSGTYTGLRLTITLARHLSYHLIQTYLPSFLLVIVSWLSFLVPPESVPGRVAICMTCLLSLIAMFASVRQSVPNVSYVKALDIWMVMCVFFVFLSLAEFTIVLKLLHVKPKKKDQVKATNMIADASLTDQSMAINHLNARRGARGSVATVYYPGVGPQQPVQMQNRLRRPSLPVPQGTLPKEQNATDEYEPQPLPQSRENIGGPNRFYTTGRPHLVPAGGGHHEPIFRPIITGLPHSATPAEKPYYAKLVKRIEFCSSFIVPTLFFAFNFVYWPWLIASSQYLQNANSTVFYSAK